MAYNKVQFVTWHAAVFRWHPLMVEQYIFYYIKLQRPYVGVCLSVYIPLFSTRPSDRNQIWHAYADRSGNHSNSKNVDPFHFSPVCIAKIRKCLNTAACKTLVHSLVTLRIDYGNAVLYGISDSLLHRLDMVQRSAARVVLRIRHGDRQSMTAALKQLHWLPVKWRVEYKLLVLVFRALHDQTPAYLASLITPYVPNRALRSAGQALLTVPRHNLERYGRRSFSCAGPILWNALPEDISMTVNINAFKAQLKTHYFKVAFN